MKKNEMALPQGRVPRHQLLNDETTDRLVYTVGTFCIKQGVEMKINICIFLEMHKGTKWLPRWRWEPGKVFELENHVPPGVWEPGRQGIDVWRPFPLNLPIFFEF